MKFEAWRSGTAPCAASCGIRCAHRCTRASRFVRGLGLCGAALLLATAGVSAQTVSWRVSSYGTAPFGAEVTPHALTFAADHGLYAFDYLRDKDAADTYVRLTRFGTDGSIVWQNDVPSTGFGFGTDPYSSANLPTAATTTIGNDVVIAVTRDGNPLAAGLTRYAAADGAVVWQTGEQNALGVGYNAVATDGAGDIVASGAVGVGAPFFTGHVAKFHGTDGAWQWAVDIDPAVCGSNTLLLPFVHVDAHGDVLVAGESPYVQQTTMDFCVLKLDGSTGATLWSRAHNVAGEHLIWGGLRDVALDSAGNVTVGSMYEVRPDAGGDWTAQATVARLSGSDGSVLWQQSATDGLTNLQSLVTDAAGNVYASARPNLTRAFAAADGSALWASDAAVGGAMALQEDGQHVLIASNRMDTPSNPHVEFYQLDTASGLASWHSLYTFDQFSSIATSALALDGAGHFASMQLDVASCCGNAITTLYGNTTGGSIGWHVDDFSIAPSYAALPDDTQGQRWHVSALTPDDGVVAAGTAYLYSALSNTRGNSRILLTKRAAHDGRLLWQAVIPHGPGNCEPNAMQVDAAGDVIVGGMCESQPVVAKFRGSDGVRLWLAQPADTCRYAVVQSLALDLSGDVFASGWCEYTNAEDQLTTRLSAADGHVAWAQHTPADLDSYAPQLVATGADRVFTLASQQIVSGHVETRVRVSALDAASGTPVWSHTFDPPAGGSYGVGNLGVLPGGDVFASASGLLVRLAGDSGAARWTSYSHGSINEFALDAGGNPVFIADNAVSKVDAATGADQWSYSDPVTVGFYGSFHDLTVAPDGSVLVVGEAYPNQDAITLLYAAALDAQHGNALWTYTDPSVRGVLTLGVLSAADGGVLVSADYAVPNGSPWSLVRITTPTADGIFANGLEP